jgi:hypothetical protein
MKHDVRVCKVPECGYVVIGRGTYELGLVVDVSHLNRDELKQLFADGYVKDVKDEDFQTPRALSGA